MGELVGPGHPEDGQPDEEEGGGPQQARQLEGDFPRIDHRQADTDADQSYREPEEGAGEEGAGQRLEPGQEPVRIDQLEPEVEGTLAGGGLPGLLLAFEEAQAA